MKYGLLVLAFFFSFHTVCFSISVKLPYDTLIFGKKMSASVFIANPSKEFKAVELTVKQRRHSFSGEELLDDTDDFLILPPQIIIAPKQERVVTLQWMGEPYFDSERSYRVIAEEVAIPMKRKTLEAGSKSAVVTIRLRFVNSFYVRPKKGHAKLRISEVRPSGNEMLVVLRNDGTRHKILDRFSLQLLSDSGADLGYHFSIDKAMLNQNINFLSGDVRHILIPWPKGLSKQAYSGRLEFD